MKRKLVCTFITVTALAITGCGLSRGTGNKDREPVKNDKQEDQAVFDDNSADSEEKEDKKAEKDDTGKKEKRLAKIRYTYQNHPLEATYGNDTFTMGGYYSIEIDEDAKDEYPELSEAIEKHNSEIEKEVRDFVNGSKEEVLEMWNEGFTGYYEEDYFLHPVRADEKVFSFVDETYAFYGGAHGSTAFAGYNYDPATGRQIEFDDVVKDTSNLPEIIVDELIDQNSDLKDYFDELPSDKDNLLAGIPDRLEDNAKGLSWAIDYDGIRINFEDYAMGTYAVGVQSMKIRFKDYPEIFTDRYADYENGKVPEIENIAEKLDDAATEVLKEDDGKDRGASKDKEKPAGAKVIRLSKDDQYKLNMFISNFSEQGFGFYDETEKKNAAALADFAYMWTKINKYKDIEMEGSYYKLSFDKINKVLDKYFGVKLSDDELYGFDKADSKGEAFCKNGYYYVPAADGESYTGFAVVEQAEDMGDGTLWLYFTTYNLDLDIYWDKGITKKYYSMSATDARDSKDLETGYGGMAIVKKAGDSYKLTYYKTY